ncbi:MAG: hypothetical protein HYX61_10225 [Gammaproteobacteria bacterium]|jgi:hypothetical protein|nr:hypothetical protein [Gammaproteobacteria bacterium]
MRAIHSNEMNEIHGGFHINLGSIVSALVVGFVTGGPVGVGIAASGLVMAQGVDNLNELLQNP